MHTGMASSYHNVTVKRALYRIDPYVHNQTALDFLCGPNTGLLACCSWCWGNIETKKLVQPPILFLTRSNFWGSAWALSCVIPSTQVTVIRLEPVSPYTEWCVSHYKSQSLCMRITVCTYTSIKLSMNSTRDSNEKVSGIFKSTSHPFGIYL